MGLIDTVLDHIAIAELPTRIAQLADKQKYKVIVTSTVAAQQVVAFQQNWPGQPEFFAVGSSSANILKQANIEVVVPQEPRTEGLLALNALQNVRDESIIIMKGYGGRELLFDSLKSRGAKVQEWEVYKRQRVSQPLSTQHWQAEQIHCIIATSGEVIEAAFDYFDHVWLKTCQWIVVSQRTANILAKLGADKIHVSRDASDQALIQSAKAI